MTERLVTARELGDLFALAQGTILDQWEAGKLPGYKIGRAVRFDPDEILAMTRREGPTVTSQEVGMGRACTCSAPRSSRPYGG